MKQRLTLLFITFAALTSLAHARAVEYFENFYVSGTGGVNLHRNEEIRAVNPSFKFYPNLTTTSATQNLDIRYNAGWHVGGSIGYLFEGFRCELELSHRHQEIRSVQLNSEIGAMSGPTLTQPAQQISERLTPQGHEEDTCIMANGIGSLPILKNLTLNLGVGLGVSITKLEIASTTPTLPLLIPVEPPVIVGPPAIVPLFFTTNAVRERDEVLAWQLIGGFTYDTLQNIVISANYRFFGTAIRDQFRFKPGVMLGSIARSIKTPYNHTIDGQISWVF